jgi:hypothetical protein
VSHTIPTPTSSREAYRPHHRHHVSSSRRSRRKATGNRSLQSHNSETAPIAPFTGLRQARRTQPGPTQAPSIELGHPRLSGHSKAQRPPQHSPQSHSRRRLESTTTHLAIASPLASGSRRRRYQGARKGSFYLFFGPREGSNRSHYALIAPQAGQQYPRGRQRSSRKAHDCQQSRQEDCQEGSHEQGPWLCRQRYKEEPHRLQFLGWQEESWCFRYQGIDWTFMNVFLALEFGIIWVWEICDKRGIT